MELASAVRRLPYGLLELKARSWFQDYSVFKAGLNNLEKQLADALQSGFDAAGTLQAKLSLLPVSLGGGYCLVGAQMAGDRRDCLVTQRSTTRQLTEVVIETCWKIVTTPRPIQKTVQQGRRTEIQVSPSICTLARQSR